MNGIEDLEFGGHWLRCAITTPFDLRPFGQSLRLSKRETEDQGRSLSTCT